MIVEPLYNGKNALTPFQQDVLSECMEKQSGGMSLAMGLGKTIITSVLSQMLCDGLPAGEAGIVVVCSKSLIGTWTSEFDKFYQGRLRYEVFHGVKSPERWAPNKDTQVIITTPEVLSKAYREYQVANMFIWSENMYGAIAYKRYRYVEKPWLRGYTCGGGLFYSTKWGCLVVDEAQEHTNIHTHKCQAIGALCAHHRWLLSGTMFNEPKVERILGFYILLNQARPRDMPSAAHMIRHSLTFAGFNPLMVIRKQDPSIVMPERHEKIVRHDLTENETKVYQSIRQVLNEVKRQVDRMRAAGDAGGARQYNSYKLALVTYLRQSLMCAIIPITSVCVDLADFKGRNHLARVLMRELSTHMLDGWLETEESIRSSRIDAVLNELRQHRDTRVILFGCFPSCLRILRRYLDPAEFNVFVMESSQSVAARTEVLRQFAESPTGVLIMTYQLGAKGLNLQCADTVFLTDFWWNDGETQQAIARVFRNWQMAPRVNIVMFTSNTGIEKAVFEKQYAKLRILDDLATGCTSKTVPRINMDDVMRIINQDENVELRQDINKFSALTDEPAAAAAPALLANEPLRKKRRGNKPTD